MLFGKYEKIKNALPPSVDGILLTSEISQYYATGFELQDGSWVSWSFEGAEILCTEGKEEICTDNFNYHVEDKGNLWSMVYYLQEEYMKDEESQ